MERVDFETAKLLKSEGFPQKRGWGVFAYNPEGILSVCTKYPRKEYREIAEFYDNEMSFAPTLEDVIEQCGYAFYLNATVELYWYAKNAQHSESSWAVGSTPLKAAINLWRVLGGKDVIP